MRYSLPFHLKVFWRRKGILSLLALLVFISAAFYVLFNHLNLDMETFFLSFLVTLAKVIIAYILALALAFLLAFLTFKSKLSEQILLPILDALQSFPSFAIFPLLLAYFGRGLESVVIILVIAMIWPILFAIIGSLKSIKEDISQAATIFGAKGFKRIINFTLPAVMPGVLTGSIVAWGEAWDVVIGAEIILASHGLGDYFAKLGQVGQISALVAAVTGLLLLLFIINKIFWLPMLERMTKYQTE